MEEIFTCNICRHQYEDPIILPCYKTTCSKHVYLETNGVKFKCDFCNNEHDLKNDKYPIDENMNKLIEISKNYIDINSVKYGKNNMLASHFCKEIEFLMNEAQLLINDPKYYINEYFNGLRNKIDLTKENYVKMIEDNYDKTISKVNDLEDVCKLNILNKPDEFKEAIKKTDDYLTNWKSDLEIPDFTKDMEWSILRFKAESEVQKLKYMINKFQNDLLLNKEYKFNAKSVSEENNFGDLDIRNIINNEDRLEGTLRMTITDFSLLKYSQNYQYSSEWCIVNKLPWNMSAKIITSNSFHLGLKVYVKPILVLDNFINTDISVKFLNNNNKTSDKINLKQSITKNAKSKFFSMKYIMDSKNEIYNEENDSVTLEATIKIVD
jgi:hypothetical protein